MQTSDEYTFDFNMHKESTTVDGKSAYEIEKMKISRKELMREQVA